MTIKKFGCNSRRFCQIINYAKNEKMNSGQQKCSERKEILEIAQRAAS